LPWESDIEFCVLNEDLMQHDESSIFGAFRRKGYLLSYDSVDGVYTAVDKNTLNDSDCKFHYSVLRIMIFNAPTTVNNYKFCVIYLQYQELL
jgi:hypothetical protein